MRRTMHKNTEVQKVVPSTLRALLLYHLQYPWMPWNLRRAVCTTVCEEIITACTWRMMFILLWGIARMRSNLTGHKRKRPLQLIPASSALKFVAMENMGPLRNLLNGNQFVLLMTARNAKLTGAVPPSQTTASHIGSLVMEKWLIRYGIATHVSMDNGTQFVSRFLKLLRVFLRTKGSTTTMFQPLNDERKECFSKTIITGIRDKVVEHQWHWENYLQPMMYAYSTQVHRSLCLRPLSLVLLQHSPRLLMLQNQTVLPKGLKSN